jgi:hypothetical protein
VTVAIHDGRLRSHAAILSILPIAPPRARWASSRS